MDMPYASIPVFGEIRRLYKDVQVKYVVSSKVERKNHPLYVVVPDLGSQIFGNDLCFEEEKQQQIEDEIQEEKVQPSEDKCIWNMHFDFSNRKDGFG